MIHFTDDEFMMGNVNVFDKMNPKFLIKLDQLRTLVREPLTLTSTYRSPDYNESVGGSKNSQHLKGNAADISCRNSKLRAKILMEALSLGLSVGINENFIHVDNRQSNHLAFLY